MSTGNCHWIWQCEGHGDVDKGNSERAAGMTYVDSRKMRGVGDTEYRQLCRRNLILKYSV